MLLLANCSMLTGLYMARHQQNTRRCRTLMLTTRSGRNRNAEINQVTKSSRVQTLPYQHGSLEHNSLETGSQYAGCLRLVWWGGRVNWHPRLDEPQHSELNGGDEDERPLATLARSPESSIRGTSGQSSYVDRWHRLCKAGAVPKLTPRERRNVTLTLLNVTVTLCPAHQERSEDPF